MMSWRKGDEDHSVAEKSLFSSKVLPQSVMDKFNQRILPRLRNVSFITLHYTYFIATCLISSWIFWGSSTPAQSVRYIDSIFLTVSAMTEAGLNTVNLSQLNTWQQVILFILIMMGSAIFVSSAVIHIRKHVFEIKLQELSDRRERRLLRPRSFSVTRRSRRRSSGATGRREAEIISGAVRGRAIHDPPTDSSFQLSDPIRTAQGSSPDRAEQAVTSESASEVQDQLPAQEMSARITFANSVNEPPSSSAAYRPKVRNRFLSNNGVGAHGLQLHPSNSLPIGLADHDISSVKNDNGTGEKPSKLDKYLDTANGYVGRNSHFHHLTEKERRKLGGIEYDALCVLSWVVPLYFVLFQLLGALGCGAWMLVNRPETATENGLNPFWTGAFFAVSAFNNSGMALLDANATALQTSYYMLLTMSLLILAGNTCFPPFLRLIFWMMKKAIPKSTNSVRFQRWRKVISFILDHPRRVYTNLFPSEATWWLVLSLVILNGIDWFAFEVLNIGNPVLDAIPARFRALDGLFQAFAVRAGGFYVVPIPALYPGTLVLYVLMMYLSAFPVTMTIRTTNVYEERSLAIFGDEQQNPWDPDSSMEPPKLTRTRTALNMFKNLNIAHGGAGGGGGTGMKPLSRTSTATPGGISSTWRRQDFVRQQLRGQLGHDLWWLALAVLFITIIETSSFHADPVNFSIFNILFEVVSAYGTVGISVGVPWNAYSFSGAWHTGSKLILCAVMLRGRHRGLPVAIDHAILLPSESLAWAEEEDGHLKRSRTLSRPPPIDRRGLESKSATETNGTAGGDDLV